MLLFRYILFVFIFILSSNTWSALVKIDDEYGNSRYENYPSELIHNSCSLDDMAALKVYSTKKEFKQGRENAIEELLLFIYRKGFKNILLSHGLLESDVDYLCKTSNRKIDNLEEEFFIYDYVMEKAKSEGEKWSWLFKTRLSSPLIKAVCRETGDINLLKFLLKAGINPNYKDKRNLRFALSYVCRFNTFNCSSEAKIQEFFKIQIKVVHLLLKNGANPNLDAPGFIVTPLGGVCPVTFWQKVQPCNIPLLNLLLAYGTSVFHDGITTIDLISQEKSPEIYDILLDALLKQSGNYY